MNKKLEEFNNNLIGKKIAIIGLGVSNIPLLDYFKNIDCEVSLFNVKNIDIDLSNYSYKTYIGENCLDNLVGFDIIFRSPSCLPNRKEIVDFANCRFMLAVCFVLLSERRGKFTKLTENSFKRLKFYRKYATIHL